MTTLPPIVPRWTEVTVEDIAENGGVIERIEWTPGTNFPTIKEVRNKWCFGLPLSKDNGEEMTDEDIKDFIDGAIDEVQKELGVYIKPTIIVSNPWERGFVEDEDYEVEEHPYDYDARSYRNYGFLQLREKPLIELYGLKLVLPNGDVIMDFMRDANTRRWVKVDKTGAQINIVPYAGDPTLFYMMGGSQSGFPFVTGALNSSMPHMFYVDYVAGYKVGKLPKDISNIIAKIASVDILGVAGDAVMVGISSTSTSMDGLSESTSLTASATASTYGAHIMQLQKEIDKYFAKGSARSFHRGFTMGGL